MNLGRAVPLRFVAVLGFAIRVVEAADAPVK
jgi:hypothetical protein